MKDDFQRQTEALEDATEAFLYPLYDEVSPFLAVLLDTEDVDIENMRVKDLKEKLETDRIVWRQPARSSVLALLDWLVAHNAKGVEINSGDWADACAEMLDFAAFKAETALDADEAKIALKMAADILASTPRIISCLYRGQYMRLESGDGIIKCEAAPRPGSSGPKPPQL